MPWPPIPRNASRKGLELICCSETSYDHGEWETYPERRGWCARPKDQWQAIFRVKQEEFQKMFETWTFWGLIESYVRKDLVITDYTELNDKNQRIVQIEKILEIAVDPFGRKFWQKTWFLSGKLASSDPFGSEAMGIPTHIRNFPRPYRTKHLGEQETGLMSFGKSEARRMNIRRSEFVSSTNNSLTLHEFLCQVKFGSEPPDPRSSILALTMHLIAEDALERLGQTSYNPRLERPPYCFCESEHFLWRRFLARNWCPFEVKTLFEQFDMRSLTFISCMDPPHSEEHKALVAVDNKVANKSKIADDEQNLCNILECHHRKISEENYRPWHIDCSGCETVSADLNTLTSILNQGDIPVVHILNSQDEIVIEMKAAKPGGYVALSHVWADGFGNPDNVAILGCQMMFISKVVSNLRTVDGQEIEYFWLDTLCVPPDRLGKNREQDLAIARMYDTYRDAALVLVLEKSLLRQTVSGMTDSESLIRMICSPWNWRLWTFQEASIAGLDRLIFRFRDDSRNGDQVYRRWGIPKRTSWDEPLRRAIMAGYKGLRVICLAQCGEILSGQKIQRLPLIWTSFQHRRTSQKTDEPLCLTNMLGLDVRRIISIPVEADHSDITLSRRMVAFWKQVEKIPLEVLFVRAQRLNVKGFRWAPKHLLECEYTCVLRRSYSMTENAYTKLQTNGLHVRLPGLVFDVGDLTFPPDWYFLVSVSGTQQIFMVCLEMLASPDVQIIRFRTGGIPLIGHRRMAVVFFDGPPQQQQSDSEALTSTAKAPGIVCEIRSGKEGGIYHVSRLEEVVIDDHRWQDMDPLERSRLRQSVEENKDFSVIGVENVALGRTYVFRAKRVGPGQEWCID